MTQTSACFAPEQYSLQQTHSSKNFLGLRGINYRGISEILYIIGDLGTQNIIFSQADTLWKVERKGTVPANFFTHVFSILICQHRTDSYIIQINIDLSRLLDMDISRPTEELRFIYTIYSALRQGDSRCIQIIRRVRPDKGYRFRDLIGGRR